jgi:hypothetical protein
MKKLIILFSVLEGLIILVMGSWLVSDVLSSSQEQGIGFVFFFAWPIFLTLLFLINLLSFFEWASENYVWRKMNKRILRLWFIFGFLPIAIVLSFLFIELIFYGPIDPSLRVLLAWLLFYLFYVKILK